MFILAIKASTRTLLYLSIAIILFLLMVNLVQFPKHISTEENAQKVALIEKKISSINTKEQVLMQMRGEYKIEKSPNSDKSIFEYKFVFFDYLFKNNNIVIPILYLLILSTLLLQVVLYSMSAYYSEWSQIASTKKLDSIFLYSSEWAINTPPVLGVVGTIFSFGMVVSNLSDMSSLSMVFKENFANASLTTIIGGLVYVINLLLNIFIAKNLSK